MGIPWRKPTIVILHGWNLSSQRFEPLAHALHAKGYRVFSFDFPGFGNAPAPKTAWHVADYASFLAKILEQKHISKPVLIGHSFGGRVALAYAGFYEDRVSALILSGTPGFSPVPKKKIFVFLVLAKIGRVLFSLPPLVMFGDVARRWLYYVAGAKDFFRAEGVMRDTFKYIVNDDLTDYMESISVPCMLLWGELDILVPVAIAKKMNEVIANSKLLVVPGADHGVPFKEPAIFASYTDRFLKSSV